MRDPDKIKCGPICDSVAFILLEESDDDNAQPMILHETQSPHSDSPIPIKSFIKFARPRGWYNQSQTSPSEFFYQLLTSETGVRRIAYILSTWEKNESTTMAKAVSIVVTSQNFHPKAFKEILLELSQNIRNPDLSSASELVKFLTDEIVEEGSTIEIRTKNLNVELGFEISPILPVTGRDVAMLFKMLGFCNVVKLVHALLSDCRIVLVSSSLMRLSRSQNALLSLLYPFVYLHSCVTILPESLFELMESPTPFLIGVLAEFITYHGDDCIIVNLDNGEMKIPDNTEILLPEDKRLEDFHCRLRNVLFKTSSQEDLAICVDEQRQPDEFVLDKKLRACFILYFAELLYGYQYFVLYTRIKGNFRQKNPTSLSFHVGAFLGFRRFNDIFTQSILKNVIFQSFLLTRALPRRKRDLFDEVSCMKELDNLVYQKPRTSKEMRNIIDYISSGLIQKERFMEKCSSRSLEDFSKIYLKNDTELNERSNSILHTIKPKMKSSLHTNCNLPVVAAHIEYHDSQFEAHSHRIEVLKNCVNAIFEKKLDTASKSLKAVEMSMKFAAIRIEFCRILHDKSTISILTLKQFDDISLLMNAALQSENEQDENGVVRSLMYLSSKFSRKLAQGVQQYMYSVIHDHKVWKSVLFWTSCFYYEVHETLFSEILKKDRKITKSLWCHTVRPCAMELIELDDTDQKRLVQQEDEIIQAQAKHFANLMIALQIPLNEDFFENNDRNISIQQEKVKWILWTLDTILSVTGRLNNLSRQHIQTLVEAHVETLRDVYLEVSASADLMKKHNHDPYLIFPNEYLICDPITCYMIPAFVDYYVTVDSIEKILPAEGCLFLTNYRIIFKGKSVENKVTNTVVVQTMPIHSYESIKKITNRKLIPKELKNIPIEHVISIRSHSAAAITIAFDDDQVDNITLEKFLEVIETSSENSFVIAQNHKVDKNESPPQKFGTLNALRKLEALTKKKTMDPKRFRTYSSHRSSIMLPFDKIEEYDHLKNNIHFRYGVLDYPRLGLNGKLLKLRMSHANIDYVLCPSYPSNFLVPSETNEAELAKIAKGFVDHRLPIVIWMNKTGALLIRGSSFNNHHMVKKLKKVVKYRRNLPKLGSALNGSQQTLTSKTSSNEDSTSNVISATDFSSGQIQMDYFNKLINAAPMTFSDRLKYPQYNSFDNSSTLTWDSVNQLHHERKSLYILVEKSEGIKIPPDVSATVLTIKIIKDGDLKKSLHRVKQIMHKEMSSDKKISFLETWNLSNWPQYLSRILGFSNSISSLISIQNSSVAICLESGKSITPILSTLTQILLDPYYRTIEGFKILIEKDWLALGHNFQTYSGPEGCSASIICFLDCVHQILNQYPIAFEFSHFFLRFIAYHTTSGFFRTFLHDCEERRLQADAYDIYVTDDLTSSSVWEYIKTKKNADIYNKAYNPEFNQVLIAANSVANIEIWSFFTEVHIKYGSPYDIDAFENEINGVENHKKPEMNGFTPKTIKPLPKYKKDSKLQPSYPDLNSYPTLFKQVQHKHAENLFEETERKNNGNTNKELSGNYARHELTPFVPGGKPVQCCICANIMTRWSKGVCCNKCNVFMHEGCTHPDLVIQNIPHFFIRKITEDMELPPAAIITHDVTFKESPSATLTRETASPFPSQIARLPPLYTGYLSKRGAKLKLWVPRFFVVYPDVPKIFYYEDFEQWKTAERPSGLIDLSDFSSFKIEPTGRRAVIELELRNKTYRLLAENANEASKWKDCIEQVIRE